MFEFFKENLEQKKRDNLYREIILPKGIDFVSNDYLSLSAHPEIQKTLISALDKGLALSSKASRLLGGTSLWHIQTEKALKLFINRPAVLSFSSGYQANLGIIPALAKNRVIFSDELNHASLIDGIRLSRRPCHIFRHNDLNHLKSLMKKQKGPKLIITESLFSMTGDFCPLEDLSQLAIEQKALLFVDEAHSTGLFGKNLGGRVSRLKKKSHIVTVHTGGKALASSGAFVGSSLLIKNYLINNCRSFIYTTAPPPILMAQWLAVLQVLKKESFRADKLKKKALWLKKELFLKETESPILFIILKNAGTALKVAQKLRKKGFFIQAIRAPTVPKDKQGLRISLHYEHTKKQLSALRDSLLNQISL